MFGNPLRRVRDMNRGFMAGVGSGAAIAYFFDPDRGRARRAKARDQLAAKGRRVSTVAGQRARYMEGQMEGLRYRVTPKPGDGERATGPTLVQKIRSEVLGKAPFRGYSISVDVEDGVVHLRGEVNRPEVIRALRDEIERMPDVDRVESMLHPPGTPAPNTVEARTAR